MWHAKIYIEIKEKKVNFVIWSVFPITQLSHRKENIDVKGRNGEKISSFQLIKHINVIVQSDGN